MQIPAFEGRAEISIGLARCERVPRLMVIAGPNGSGKSTLLNALRPGPGRNVANAIYVPPHRAIRPQRVQQSDLLSAGLLSMAHLMAGNHTPQVGNFKIGLNPFTGGSTGRDPWDVDDVSTYLKPVLCQVEIERKEAVTYRYDRDGEIARDSLVDPWKPLRDLTRHLLPHLAFAGIMDSTTP